MPAECFGSVSAILARFLEWEKAGLFEVLWKAGLADYDELKGIAWRWQSIDSAIMKAVTPTPPIGGNGNKRHLLVEGRGIPLSLVVPGGHRHDVSQLEAVLDAIMLDRRSPPL